MVRILRNAKHTNSNPDLHLSRYEMSSTLTVVMDPIGAIKINKDSTFAMLLEAQARGWTLQYTEQGDLYLEDGEPWVRIRPLRVMDDVSRWYVLKPGEDQPLKRSDVILMRKDPPFDMEYIYSTYILELARDEALVVNDPVSVRDANEKLFTSWFPQCCPPSLVTRHQPRLKAFLQTQHDIVVKPLDSMGGSSVFRVQENDPNVNVIFETLTHQGRRMVMAQRYIPEVSAGDKRILLIDGEPLAYALARIPANGETRANLAVGGTARGQALSERDRWICAQVGPALREKGLLFVGLDVIGDYLTEINVTSPTGIRELDRTYGLNIAGQLMDVIASRIGQRRSEHA